jgi:hypothetical protein
MSRRRAIWVVLIGLLSIALYNFAVLAFTSAGFLGLETPLDSWRKPVKRSSIWIGTMETDVYEGPRSDSTVLIIHGVNETGKDSPQLTPIAETLARSGFRVVVPEFSRMTRQNVTSADIKDVAFAFDSLPTNHAGIICVSYGCGPALIAASLPEIRERVRFVLTFGAYFDLTQAVRLIVTEPPTPLGYSKWIYMEANADLIADKHDREVLIAIAEERRCLPPEDWVLTEEDLGPEAQKIFALFESSSIAEFNARLSATPALKERMESLSPSLHFGGLRADLIVIHLSSDPSIPSTESLGIANAAKLHGIPYSLTFFKMYGHTRPDWPRAGIRSLIFFYLPESWKFMRVVNQVLSYA